jgi:colanic acid biosynthesis protein WcaH
MTIHEAIKFLDKQISNSSLGLPKEVFLFISRLTPLVNVDLLIKDENGKTLLSWRNDQYAGVGWHVPGGIVRFKENLETRIMKVAEEEIGAKVDFDPVPIAVNQFICSHNTRGHFISLLYKCFLSGKYIPKNKGLKKSDNGYLMWHNFCPEDLVKIQKKVYGGYL